MPRYDFRTPRLFVEVSLGEAASVPLDGRQANYLINVLRLRPGDPVLVFNGRDGEWQALLRQEGRKSVSLSPSEQTRPQPHPKEAPHYLFAPLKHARLDYMVQKAVELGVSRLQPVSTLHTQASRVNLTRMRANAIEAAEQCGILTIAEVAETMSLPKALNTLSSQRTLIFCDEDAETCDPITALSQVGHGRPLAVLVGPEGGFAEEERQLLLRHPNVVRLALGPRILRADTAAVAALTLVQATLGDWR